MIFLKLGGSLITRKSEPDTPRRAVLTRLADEVREARSRQPDLRLLIGHGSGSFGHTAAARHKTQLGASTRAEWLGFAEVWRSANQLNRLVIDALTAAGLPVVNFSPSASAICEQGVILDLAVETIERAIQAGLIPIVHGDVAFDRVRGATILSTESIFFFLASRFRPERVLLAGIEPGVYSDMAKKDRVLTILTEDQLPLIALQGSASPDVTGGMAEKVHQALDFARAHPETEIRILSGASAGEILRAICGEPLGTLISAGNPERLANS